MFFVLWATRLPTQVARTHTTGNLKVQQRSLGGLTHTHTQDKHTQAQIIDRPQSQPTTLTSSTPPGTISCRNLRKESKKKKKENDQEVGFKKKSG